MTPISAAVTLFLVLDPLGNIPFFLSTLKTVEESRRQRVVIRELLIAYAALTAFLFVGRPFISFLQLRSESITIAGGIILFIISIRMIFPGAKHPGNEEVEGEPLLVPLAIPGVAGPAALATVLLITGGSEGQMIEWFAALTAAWFATAMILVASPFLFRILRKRGLIAMERLMGMILVALSVQMFLDGVAAAA